jgi:predicted kinase
MNTFHPHHLLPVDTTIPDPSLVCLIGAAGSGKTTWARTWPATQVLELDMLRAMVSDDAGCQEATGDAVLALQTVLEARLARRKLTVIDATNTEPAVRATLIDTARRHDVPAVALVVPTPASVCVARQQTRPANRRVPQEAIHTQYSALVDAFSTLPSEGFRHVVLAHNLHRLEVLLRRASNTQRADLGWDSGAGLGDLLLVRRVFGPEVLPVWRWREVSLLAGGDRVGEIRLGADRMVLALRTNVDGHGDVGFDLLVACPWDDDCDAPAWRPVVSVTDLLDAHTSTIGHYPEAVCNVHGSRPETAVQEVLGHDCNNTPDEHTDPLTPYAAAVRT